jgi:hypothetical protein
MAVMLGSIQNQIQKFVPFIARRRAFENHQVILGAGVECTLWKLNQVIFNHHSPKREKIFGFNLAEALASEFFI